MENTKKKSRKKLIVIISLAVFIIAVPLIAFLVNKKGGKEVNTYVISNNADNSTIINGVVSPEDSSNIFLDPSKGNDFSIKVKEGQAIKEGDILIKYNTDSIESKISSMESEIRNNKNQINDLNKGGAPLKEQANMLRSTVKSLESELRELRKQKDSFIVTSPMDGIISEVNSGNNNPNNPVIVLETKKKIIKGQLTEYELPNVTLSTNASVSLKALGGDKYYTSKIIKIARNPSSNAVDAGANVMGGSPKISNYAIAFNIPKDIEGRVENGFHALVKLGKPNNKLTLPKSAVYKDVDKGHKMVWAVKDNKALSKEVEVKDNGNDYIIVGGIKSGEKVIINAPKKLKEGDEVTLK